MATASEDRSLRLEQLSALVDGEIDAGQASRMCAAWRDEAALRGSWHAYQLIGDVLRSDDLASDPKRDAAFLAALRKRLAAEPAVFAPRPSLLAPQPAVSAPQRLLASAPPRLRRWGWGGPAAVAAGFVVVAGAVIVLRAQAPQQAPALAQAAPGAPAGVVPASVGAVDPQVLIADPTLIRDARLDRYLAAHKQFAGSSALGAPSGYLRAATGDAARR